jgi:hypothetical protein
MNELTHLVVENGEAQGRELSVPPAGALIGRATNNEIVLPDHGLSRHHCRLFFKNNGRELWVKDLDSANHVYVNGTVEDEARLRPGDVLLVGGTSLRVLAETLRKAAVLTPPLAHPPAPAGEVLPPAPPKPQPPEGCGLVWHALAWIMIVAAWVFLLCSLVPPAGRISAPAGTALTGVPPPAVSSTGSPGESAATGLPGESAGGWSGGAMRPAPASEADLLAEVKRSAAKMLLGGPPDRALAELDRQIAQGYSPGLTEGLQEVRAYVAGLSGVDGLLADAYATRLGGTLSVRYRGRQVKITPRAVVQDRVLAVLQDGAATNSLEIPFSHLQAPGIVNWLPPAGTAAEHGMLYIVAMRNGNQAKAIEVAPRCGPMAAAFGEIAGRTARQP